MGVKFVIPASSKGIAEPRNDHFLPLKKCKQEICVGISSGGGRGGGYGTLRSWKNENMSLWISLSTLGLVQACLNPVPIHILESAGSFERK